MTIGATVAGTIMGTAAYMAPEQAKGKRVDKRADIWAFGVVLYELLTGDRLFKGEDVSDVLAHVLTKEPDLERVPAKSRRLLAECLQKDPKLRLRDIGDAKRLLSGEAPGSSVPSGLRTRFMATAAIAATAIIFAAGATWIAWRATRPVERPLIRLSVDLGPDAVAGNSTTVAISPDGTRIAFPVRGPSGSPQLATRLLDQATPTLLSGTEGGRDPFFSPDGQWIGFFADSKLKKISVLGGAALTLCDAPNGRGGSWGEDGNIVAALQNGAGLSRVPEAGGAPQTLTKPAEKGETTHRWPQVLPGAHAVLFTGTNTPGNFDDGNIEAISLKTGETRVLLRGGYFGRYLPSNGSSGHLVYLHEGVLFGVRFDPVKLALSGAPSPLLEDVAGNTGDGGGQFGFAEALSGPGTLIYLSGKSSSSGWSVAWMDSSGKTEPLLAKTGAYYTPRFSPDGNWLALAVNAGKGLDLFVYDWHHDTMPRLTFNGLTNRDPVWAPDGKHIAFDSIDGLYWVRADGAGEPQRLLETKYVVIAFSFSPDGKRLSYVSSSPETGPDLWTLPLDLSDPEHPKPGKPEPFLRTPAQEFMPMFSPDGHWMAYASNETGRQEIYVRPFPGPSGKWQISTGGGVFPVWSRKGRELFYENSDRLMVTEYTSRGEVFSYSKPRPWSDKEILNVGNRPFYDLAPDGKRFAVFPKAASGDEKQGSVHATFLLNFFDEVRRRIPAGK